MLNLFDFKKEEWLEILVNKIKNLDDNIYFVVYSLGFIMLLNYLEKLNLLLGFGGFIFVSGFFEWLLFLFLLDFFIVKEVDY